MCFINVFNSFLGVRRNMALVLKDVKKVTNFILNYSDAHGLCLHGRVPDFSKEAIKVLGKIINKEHHWGLLHCELFLTLGGVA